MHIKKNDLFNKVLEEPITTLAKKFSISTYELEKLCKENNIPLPKASHWMKVKFGKRLSNKLPEQHTLEFNQLLNQFWISLQLTILCIL